MKYLLILSMLSIIIFSCDDKDVEKPQDEEVILSISHIKILGECDDLSYCKFEFIIEQDSIYTKKNALEYSNLPEVKKGFINSDIKIDSLSNLINFNNIDSINYISISPFDVYFELIITTNLREIYVKYGNLPEAFKELDNYIRLEKMNFEF